MGSECAEIDLKKTGWLLRVREFMRENRISEGYKKDSIAARLKKITKIW